MENNIVSNCPLCGEHSLHCSGEKETEFMQCISCGYISHSKLVGNKKTNDEYKKMDALLQKLVKESNDRIWIPIQMNLPFGAVYPALVDNKMKWVFAEMVDIPKEEQKNYPIPDKEDSFYEKRYETEDVEFFEKFVDAFKYLQDKLQSETQQAVDEDGIKQMKMPKEKKID
tara:strand:+ start:3194 stop:3706 length:513 start_codon:yes stop_codon:yes gene_type:complete